MGVDGAFEKPRKFAFWAISREPKRQIVTEIRALTAALLPNGLILVNRSGQAFNFGCPRVAGCEFAFVDRPAAPWYPMATGEISFTEFDYLAGPCCRSTAQSPKAA